MKKIIFLWFLVFLCITKPVLAEEDNVSLKSEYYVLMEAKTGKVIAAKNEEEVRSPASITKIMTVLLIFEAIEQKKISLQDIVVTSEHAKSMGGSQVFLEEGEEQTVETLIKCILIASGNDASVAMAEKIGGTEENFVEMMNKKAKELGMNNTHFVDCCGLSDSDEHFTTAKDVAIVSRELVVKYPEVLEYSSIWMETIIHKTKKGEKEFVLSNTNKLLKANDNVKGLKTGSTSKAKYCVSNVAVKDGITLISVIMSAPDYKVRFSDSNKLLNYGFSQCKLFKDDSVCREYTVLGGEKTKVQGKKLETYYVDTEGINFEKIEKKEKVDSELKAPIKKGSRIGCVEYYYGGKVICQSDIIAEENIEKSNYLYYLKALSEKMMQLA